MKEYQRSGVSLFKSIVQKDELTAQHSLHVAHLFKDSVCALGVKFDTENAYIAGLFHDIGKIYAPDVIFSNKSPLPHEEYELVKRHPVDSYRILKEWGIPEKICEIALFHHERANGSGYPLGLILSDIPDIISLMAIVDSFCAIVERCAYRNPVNIQTAIEILLKDRHQYDWRLLKDYCSYLKSTRNDRDIFSKSDEMFHDFFFEMPFALACMHKLEI